MSRRRIARWMLREVGARSEVRALTYGPEMRDPSHLALKPRAKVPTLRQGVTAVTRCGAICAYLADAFPKTGLAPPPVERGSFYRCLVFGAGPVEAATINTALGFSTDEAQRQAMLGYGALERVVDTLVAAVAAPRSHLHRRRRLPRRADRLDAQRRLVPQAPRARGLRRAHATSTRLAARRRSTTR